MISLRVLGAGMLLFGALVQPLAAQTRERGPWWPSVHGPDDQAGASNYVTPAKILAALALGRPTSSAIRMRPACRNTGRARIL
jgi:hypothetical protein